MGRRGRRLAAAHAARQAGASVANADSPRAQASRRTGDRGPLVRDVSAGGVVFRREAEQGHVRLALVGRIKPRRWALPKGTPRKGETVEQTAVREVSEETGLQVRVVEPIGDIQYWFVWGGVRHFKTVHFFLMEMTGGDTADHDAEYDVVEWFEPAEALSLLSYPNEAKVVEQALESLSAGRRDGPTTGPEAQ